MKIVAHDESNTFYFMTFIFIDAKSIKGVFFLKGVYFCSEQQGYF